MIKSVKETIRLKAKWSFGEMTQATGQDYLLEHEDGKASVVFMGSPIERVTIPANPAALRELAAGLIQIAERLELKTTIPD